MLQESTLSLKNSNLEEQNYYCKKTNERKKNLNNYILCSLFLRYLRGYFFHVQFFVRFYFFSSCTISSSALVQFIHKQFFFIANDWKNRPASRFILSPFSSYGRTYLNTLFCLSLFFSSLVRKSNEIWRL